MRVPSYDVAELESQIGPRGISEINSANRPLVQNWLCAQGFPSVWCKKRRVRTLTKAYNDPSYLAYIISLRDAGTLGDMDGPGPVVDEGEIPRETIISSPACEVCGQPGTCDPEFAFGMPRCPRHGAEAFPRVAEWCASEVKRLRMVNPTMSLADALKVARGEMPEPPRCAAHGLYSCSECSTPRTALIANEMGDEGGYCEHGIERDLICVDCEGDEFALPYGDPAVVAAERAIRGDFPATAPADPTADMKLAVAAEALRAASSLAKTHELLLEKLSSLGISENGTVISKPKTHGDGTIPGTEMVKASDLFPGIPESMMVPRFAEPTQHTPDVDEAYTFDVATTTAILLGFAHDRRVLVSGKHGTGKSSHIEQVAARLNWPFFRLNLDGHISRTDMIGRDAIILEDGKQITQFNEGILPWAMQQPMALCLDEYDAGRPDVLFVVQRLLESSGKLTIAEQNRVVTPHQGFRIFGTANTVGLGDASGLYHGTNALNAAQMDRWSLTVKLDYLPKEHEIAIVMGKVSGMSRDTVASMVKTAALTRALFGSNKISTVMSPRTVITWAENAKLMGMDTKIAFALTFGNRCDEAEMPHIDTCYNEAFR